MNHRNRAKALFNRLERCPRVLANFELELAAAERRHKNRWRERLDQASVHMLKYSGFCFLVAGSATLEKLIIDFLLQHAQVRQDVFLIGAVLALMVLYLVEVLVLMPWLTIITIQRVMKVLRA